MKQFKEIQMNKEHCKIRKLLDKQSMLKRKVPTKKTLDAIKKISNELNKLQTK